MKSDFKKGNYRMSSKHISKKLDSPIVTHFLNKSDFFCSTPLISMSSVISWRLIINWVILGWAVSNKHLNIFCILKNMTIYYIPPVLTYVLFLIFFLSITFYHNITLRLCAFIDKKWAKLGIWVSIKMMTKYENYEFTQFFYSKHE